MLDDPADDQLQPLHDRTYAVQVFRRDARCIMVRGMVHDLKPPGLYIEDDPDPLSMHRMRVELEIDYPALVIRAADVEFDDFPQLLCPMIADDYGALVGVSITRGFTHRVRELFGGPRGCAHVDRAAAGHGPRRGAVDLVDGDPEPAGGDGRRRPGGAGRDAAANHRPPTAATCGPPTASW